MQYKINSKYKTGAFVPSAASNVKVVEKNKEPVNFDLIEKLNQFKQEFPVKIIAKKSKLEKNIEKVVCNEFSGGVLPIAAESVVYAEKKEFDQDPISLKKLEEAAFIQPHQEILVFLNITRISDSKYVPKVVNSVIQDVEANEKKIFELNSKISEAIKREEFQPNYSDMETFQFPKTRTPRFDLVAALGWEEILPNDEPPLDVANVCGFKSSWVYKCTPWRYHIICVENITEGAWVPYPVMQRRDYEDCEIITQSSGRQFSKDHGSDYK